MKWVVQKKIAMQRKQENNFMLLVINSHSKAIEVESIATDIFWHFVVERPEAFDSCVGVRLKIEIKNNEI